MFVLALRASGVLEKQKEPRRLPALYNPATGESLLHKPSHPDDIQVRPRIKRRKPGSLDEIEKRRVLKEFLKEKKKT